MTIVDICNQALSMIGDLNITSLDEQSKAGRLCKQFFPLARDKVLTDYEWSFATRYKTLPQLEETPEHSGFLFQYALPNDVLHVQEVVNTDEFQKIGASIHANISPLTIMYTQKMDDTEKFPAEVSEAISLYLGYKISTPMSADPGLKQMLYQEYFMALEDAKGKDGLTSQGDPEGIFWVDR